MLCSTTHMSALSMLSTRRTGSLTFMSSVTFIPYTIRSTASPRCCGCCARFWGVAKDCCGRRAAAARADAGAKVGAKPLFRITAAAVRVNRACIINRSRWQVLAGCRKQQALVGTPGGSVKITAGGGAPRGVLESDPGSDLVLLLGGSMGATRKVRFL